MKAYSQDLRERALAAWTTGAETQAEVAEQFGISKSTLEKWSYALRDTGRCAVKLHGGGRVRVLAGCESLIRTALKQQPDRSLAELCADIAAATSVLASPSTLCRELQRLQLGRKKVCARQST